MFWRLLLAHLLGDYPLQPDRMVANKQSVWVQALHIAIHFTLMFALVGPVRSEVWPQLLLLASIHLFLDRAKTALTKRWKEHAVLQYFVDQALHVISIFAVTIWIEGTVDPSLLPQDSTWAVYASGYLVVTYVWFITERVIAVENSTYLRELDEQFWSRMISRALMLTLILIVGSGFEIAALGLVLPIPYVSGTYRRRALVTDLLVAFVTALVVLVAV
ncbi:MAG: DUF3307 domain-containing protein [Anaerolineales bacterium]|nr:DUF3307 domain-containing protein [Anaerolineales bacterium]